MPHSPPVRADVAAPLIMSPAPLARPPTMSPALPARPLTALQMLVSSHT
jgi:hypothetical protein